MASVRIQGESEKLKGIYYEYNPADTPLGVGGMGKVFKGWCCSEMTNQRREVAIKFLYSDLPSNVVARARREAAVQLMNDNLIEMIGFVETSEKDELGQSVIRYHVISEYLHGVTLDKLLIGNVCDHKGNVIPFAQELYGKYMNDSYGFALTVIRNLLSGLMALHDAGYIHRDIDPSNIMVTSNGKIKLIDFGIAKKTNGDNTKESSYTIDGQFIGKPKYASPELVRGLVDSQDATTDLYAVGILLYQLLVGKVPFDGEMAEVLDMQLNKKMPLHNVKQRQIKEVIKTATQKKRSMRYQSAAEFRVAVDKLIPLQYPAKTIDFKTIGISVVSAAVFAGLILTVLDIYRDKDAVPNDSSEILAQHQFSQAIQQEENVTSDQHSSLNTYDEAVRLLSQKNTAEDGFNMLKTLAGDNNYNATFLLSRLYFNSSESVKIGSLGDSVTLFRNNLGIVAQNEEAHRLLKSAVNINSEDYRSLFELGCDYKSKKRGAVFNTDSAYIYLNKARQLAAKAGDKEYEQAIADRMINLKPVRDE